MNQHYTNKELTQLINGNFAVQKMVGFSQHIAQCATCKNNLEKIAPEFVEKQKDIPEHTHFSEMELIAFLKADIPLKNRLEMSEHLRNCPICKTKLYAQNPQFIKQTVSTYLSKDEITEKKSFFSNLNVLVPIGAMAALLIALLLFALPKPELDSLQTKIEDNSEIPPITADNFEEGLPVSPNKTTDLPTQNPTKSSAEVAKKTTPKSVVKDVIKSKDEVKFKSKDEVSIKLKKPDSFKISTSRSSNSDCESEDKVAVISPNFEEITEIRPTFRWKNFKNAVKYNIYISDTSQILLEEAEIVNETFYKSKTQLDRNKPYKWSVVATTEDGKTYPSLPIEFSLGKKAQKYKIARTSNETRCEKKKEQK